MTATFPQSLDWVRAGTDRLLADVDRLSDADLDGATALSGWSRRHLLSHVGYNAEALRRLAGWARTGIPSPMYASPEQRAQEIAEGSTWPAERLRRFVRDSAEALAADLSVLGAEHWSREVRTAQGRTVPATEIPWLRTREVAVHAVDLATGTGFDDLHVELCEALVGDVALLRSSRGDGPELLLSSTTGRTWTVAGAGPATSVAGRPAQLASWVTGRGTGGLTDSSGAPVPMLARWL